MRKLLAAALAIPSITLADGGLDDPPPKPTVFCTGSQVYDPKLEKCVDPESGSLDRDALYLAVRQLAYAGRYLDAQGVMETLPENDPVRLTYMGFTHRKLGNVEQAMDYYQQALDRDPANNMARSYMGQGFVAEGLIYQAVVQLQQIRAHGGTGSWSEISLKNAIETGQTYNH
jgi:tetratricopeptide (TPR) repeat protein